MPRIRVIRLKFDKHQWLVRAGTEMMAPDDSYDSRAVGDSRVEENITTAYVYLALPFFPDTENENQLKENDLEWWRTAESVYRNAHPDKKVLFKDPC